MEKHHYEEHHNFKLYFILYIIGALFYAITFIFPSSFNTLFYYLTLVLSGFHVVGDGLIDTVKSTIKARRFRPNVHLLMALGSVGAVILGDFHEAIILILIFAGAHFLEDFAEDKSSQAIEKLLKLNVHEARLLLEDGTTKIIKANDLVVGNKVLVLEGDEIPSDGIIIEGTSDVNEANITGESIPKTKTVGDQVFGSTLNGDSTLVIEINRSSEDTVIAKIIKMVSETKKDLSQTAILIKKIEPIYVTVVLLIAPIFFLLGRFAFGLTNHDAFYRTMVFLIGTSPCALAVTDIPASLSALSNLAKNGILFKGSSHLAHLGNLNAIAFDKTGTLTTGKPVVTNYHFFDKDEKLYQDIIVAMEKNSNHPLALAVLNAFDNSNLVLDVENITGVGLKTTYQNNNYLLGKATQHNNLTEEIKALIQEYEEDGKTVVLFSNDQQVLSLLAFLDVALPSAKDAIAYFNNNNVETVMITGDTERTANKIASEVGVQTIYANVLPEDKAQVIKNYKNNNNVISMIGDGINDAPALASSNIGIAMGDGTDIAIEVADGVLMDKDLNKITYAHRVAKKLKSIVMQNIIFSLLIILTLVFSNIFGFLDMKLAVVFHEGSTLVVILNGLRMLLPIKKS